MLSEFNLITRYFAQHHTNDPRIGLGIGDDCALLNPTPGMQLAISTDMLVEGRHFFANADPTMLGHKCLAVNLSDLAAMGANPLAFTLALSLPKADPEWLQGFSTGLFALAEQHHCHLIGGDTTKGPLNICITVFGEIPKGKAIQRNTAKIGDDIWVSGQLGEARLALAAYLAEPNIRISTEQHLQAALRLHQPTPRIALGLALRGIANAALDLSDGLVGDLGHILSSSHVGASLWVDSLPIGPILNQQALHLRRELSLSGGDDYELCFTASPDQREAVLAAGITSATQVTRIGIIQAQAGLRLLDDADKLLDLRINSFDHFS